MTSTLHGKRCLVTGGSRGLGNAIAKELKAAGALVFLTARDPILLEAAASDLGVPWASADLSDPGDVEQMADEVERVIGGVDILVNAAGVFPVLAVGETSILEFDKCMAVNVRAPFQLARRCIPGMVQRGWGRILNIASSSAYSGFKNTSAYCASKHALLGLSRALHDELKSSNVRVQCVSPGSIKTDMGKQVVGQDFDTFLDPNDVAGMVLNVLALDGSMIVDELRLSRAIIR